MNGFVQVRRSRRRPKKRWIQCWPAHRYSHGAWYKTMETSSMTMSPFVKAIK